MNRKDKRREGWEGRSGKKGDDNGDDHYRILETF